MNPILKEDVENIIKEDIAWSSLKDSSVMITGAGGMIGMYSMAVLVALNEEKDYI